jgi:hypothetical protein
VTTGEDTVYAYSVEDFPFSDVDGDSLAKLQIGQLPSVGTLLLSGADVTLNQEVSTADIAADNLTFLPQSDANGTPYDSFEFRVHDGTEYSVDSYVMTINVAPVNDPPAANDDTLETPKDVELEIPWATLWANDSDIDSPSSSWSISDVSGAAHGNVGNDFDTKTVSFVPESGFDGKAEFKYTLSDGDGGSDEATVIVNVVFPWQNPSERKDVNNDGEVVPADVLFIYNELNVPKFRDPKTGKLPPTRPEGAYYYDVNADSHATPLDALAIINHLNGFGEPEGERGRSGLPFPTALRPFLALAHRWDTDAISLLRDDPPENDRERHGQSAPPRDGYFATVEDTGLDGGPEQPLVKLTGPHNSF